MGCSHPGCTNLYEAVFVDRGERWCHVHNPNNKRTHKPKPEPVKLTGQVTKTQTVTLDAHQLRQLIAEAVGQKLGIEVRPDDLTFDCGVDAYRDPAVTIRSEVVYTLPKPPATRGV